MKTSGTDPEPVKRIVEFGFKERMAGAGRRKGRMIFIEDGGPDLSRICGDGRQ